MWLGVGCWGLWSIFGLRLGLGARTAVQWDTFHGLGAGAGFRVRVGLNIYTTHMLACCKYQYQ